MEKKTWVMPELIVLQRSKPEESVLVACKTESDAGMPTTAHAYCEAEPAGDCPACAILLGS